MSTSSARSNASGKLPIDIRPKLYVISIVAAALALAGILMISRYAADDLSRDLRTWQDKMNIIISNREDEVNQWVGSHYDELQKLSQNPSLQLYITEMESIKKSGKSETSATEGIPDTPNATAPDELAQKTYLRNLLMFTADHMGFSPENVPLSMQIPTQINYDAPSGIAVLNAKNEPLVSTPYLNGLDEHVQQQLQSIPLNTPGMIDLYPGSNSTVKIAFVTPVYSIQADPQTSTPIARIVGVKQINEEFFSLLKKLGATERSMEALLVRRQGGNINYISVLADGDKPLNKIQADEPQTLAASFAVDNPGEFGIREDYRGNKALVIGRNIPKTPWTLLLKIDYNEAMAASNLRRNGMIALFLLALGVVIATVIAVWYSASSRRAIVASKFFKTLAERTEAQKKLLKIVTDNHPEAIFLLDIDHRIHFTNAHIEEEFGIDSDNVTGKKVQDVIGPVRAEEIILEAEAALQWNEQVTRIRKHVRDGVEYHIQSKIVPLEHLPIEGLTVPTPGVLIVEEDISGIMREREQRLRLHKQLVDTLVAIVDRRDPNAANHSRMVSTLASEIAETMKCDEKMIDTIRTAGCVMNIGKIMLSPELLTKTGELNDKERKEIQGATNYASKLLADIDFEGPVFEILDQRQEKWDGSGAKGLKEEDILLGARIIAVANACVGMISPRSYRKPIPLEEALKTLREQSGKLYDRKVVVALDNYLENEGGKEELQRIKAA